MNVNNKEKCFLALLQKFPIGADSVLESMLGQASLEFPGL